jgi:hypothetical protein
VALNIDYLANSLPNAKWQNKTVETLQEYLGYPELFVLYNTEYFDNKKFDDDCIKRLSRIHTQHIDKRTPTWAQTKLVSHVVYDAINYVDLGIAKEREFFSYEMQPL